MLSKTTSKPVRVACFISPHGFGHAARAAAVMEALTLKVSKISFDIFTSVPQWFFTESLSGFFSSLASVVSEYPLEY